MRFVTAAAGLAEQDDARERASVQLNDDMGARRQFVVDDQNHFAWREVVHHGRQADLPGVGGNAGLHLKSTRRLFFWGGLGRLRRWLLTFGLFRRGRHSKQRLLSS